MEDRLRAIEQAQIVMRDDIDRLQAEEHRTRSRLHDLESDRAALRHLTKVASDVFEAAKKMQDDALAVIESAAVSAVAKAFRARSELRWKYLLRISTILGGMGAFAYVFVAVFFK